MVAPTEGSRTADAGRFEFTTCTLADLDTLTAFNQALAQESEGIALEPGTIRAGVEAVLRDRTKGTYYALREGGQIVCQLMTTYEWSDWSNAVIWWIQSVFTAQTHRRQGLYRLLYEKVKGLAREAGACSVRLYADKDNERALKTYKSLGMSSHYLVFEESLRGAEGSLEVRQQ